jgi:alanyl-tRNA synthetase
MSSPSDTERLHYDDPLLLSFDARVLARSEHRGRPSLILDRSAFYPEAGGQMADRGTIGGLAVIDVQLDDDGRVHHVLAPREPQGELPEIGAHVEGTIDAARRREHMALHTGQHALSRALLDELGAVTVSSRLGESACTIDVDKGGLGLADVRRAEDRVNAIVDADRPIRQFFPSDAELARMALRKAPPAGARVRVVSIEGFDDTPCGGTHCTHTSQIELVFVDSVERYKGGTRITFAAGPRARRLLTQQAELLRQAASALGSAAADVPAQLEKLHAKIAEARDAGGRLRGQLASLWAERLRAETVVAVLPDADAALLKAVAEKLEGARLIAIAAPAEAGTDVLIASKDAALSAGELLKRVAQAAGGRGGGRPELAQGRLPAGTDFVALVRAAL